VRTILLGAAIAALCTWSSSNSAFAQTPNKAAYEGKVLETADAVRLFYFTHGETPQAIQDFVNLVRSTADLQRIMPVFPQRTVVLRGTPDQIALAEWLFSRLDQSVNPQSAKPVAFDTPGANGAMDAVRVFYFTHEEAPQDLQQMTNLLRSLAGIQRTFPYTARKAIALRGSPEQIAVAEWLYGELDQPVTFRTERTSIYKPSAPAGTDALRVFFLSHNETEQEMQEIINMLRTTTEIQRIVSYPPRTALAVRGTPAQIALAEWLIKQIGTVATEPPRPR
jgi:hypothetical protein